MDGARPKPNKINVNIKKILFILSGTGSHTYGGTRHGDCQQTSGWRSIVW